MLGLSLADAFVRKEHEELVAGCQFVFGRAPRFGLVRPASGQYQAFSAVCTHVGCIVNKVANGTIDCPCHGSQFKVTTGAVVAGPAPSPLPAKQITIVGGRIILL